MNSKNLISVSSLKRANSLSAWTKQKSLVLKAGRRPKSFTGLCVPGYPMKQATDDIESSDDDPDDDDSNMDSGNYSFDAVCSSGMII